MPEVFIRADGNQDIGLGHVFRSLALASMLKNDFTIHFLTNCDIPAVHEQIKKETHSLEVLQNAENEAELFSKRFTGNEIVVLDGYHFDGKYQQQIKTSGCKLVNIDDIYNTHFYADVVINHAPGLSPVVYNTEPYTKIFLGAEFLLLREPFLKMARTDISFINTKELFVSLGGADANNDLLKVLEITMADIRNHTLNIVLGGAYRFEQELKVFLKVNDLAANVFKNIDADQLVELMSRSSSAICAPSTVCLEYLCSGGTLFLHQTADNQKDVYKNLIGSGNAYSLQDYHEMQFTASTQSKISDGLSNVRLLNIFKALNGSA